MSILLINLKKLQEFLLSYSPAGFVFSGQEDWHMMPYLIPLVKMGRWPDSQPATTIT